MPNLDFYATIEDHKTILNYLFEAKDCEVYELSSDPEKPLNQFFSTDEVLNEFNRTHTNGKKLSSIYLQIFVSDCGYEFKPTKVILNPEKCNGFTYRFSADQFGLIQLYLEAPTKKGLKNSHTNHNTKERAKKWARTQAEVADVESCDFNKITKFSSELNRFIRKTSLAKLTSKPVLPGAFELWNSKMSLHPYLPNEAEIQLNIKN